MNQLSVSHYPIHKIAILKIDKCLVHLFYSPNKIVENVQFFIHFGAIFNSICSLNGIKILPFSQKGKLQIKDPKNCSKISSKLSPLWSPGELSMLWVPFAMSITFLFLQNPICDFKFSSTLNTLGQSTLSLFSVLLFFFQYYD